MNNEETYKGEFSKLINEHAEEVRRMKMFLIFLKLQENAKPIFIRPRPTPYGLWPMA